MTTVPAHSLSAPARAFVIAAARFMPGVCGVLMSSSFACTTRTPRCFHFDSLSMCGLLAALVCVCSTRPEGNSLVRLELSVVCVVPPFKAAFHGFPTTARSQRRHPGSGVADLCRIGRPGFPQARRHRGDQAQPGRARKVEPPARRDLPQGGESVQRGRGPAEHRLQRRAGRHGQMGQVGNLSMTSLSLRESVLAFMTSNPTAWRIKALAAKLGVGVQRMGLELSQLNAEGKLVSCTVRTPGRQPEEEYRIAATEQKMDPHHFVISRKTNVRLRGAG